ncbi:MAG: BrnA antitoxin family protein [Alphaproteobacteria bacterium]|nr:BrnA antitoxin family protein [Alphaproteobacteria bacterium]
MKKTISKRLTPTQLAEIKALAAMREAQIDTKDIPEVRDWSGAQRGLFYRPVKKQLTLRLDADIITWFKNRQKQSKGYQTCINNALREYIDEHAR